jgi:alkanesulfonate monooxygenase SsuD/methylene tetrahydromethanopterin reductase-like flavin-dependent oxidoreductase (luciferase family)
LAEEIAIVDQMLGGRMELGLVPGINADYFRPFGLDYDLRKSPTLEFVDYMRAAFGETQPFSFHGSDFHTDHLFSKFLPHGHSWRLRHPRCQP